MRVYEKEDEKHMTKKIVKQKKSMSSKIASLAAGIIALALITFFMSNSISEFIKTVQLNKELKLVESQLEVLETRQSELTLEKTKLEDPTYVQNYARGTHLLSKSEEQVFILPKGND